MSADNLSAVLHGPKDLRMEQTPIAEPQDDDVQLKISSVGICGTDLHFWEDAATGRFIVRSPMVLGHETSAVVTKVGANVTHVKVGDHVAIEPNMTCRNCEFCKKGRYNLCPNLDLTEVTPYRGHLRRLTISKADLVFKLPENISQDEGALVEPFAVAVQACKRAGLTAGQKVLVCGAGPIGLLCMAAARAFGADTIVQTDIVDEKLKVAKEMGANHTINVCGLNAEEISNKVKESLGDCPEVTFECTGFEQCLQTAVFATKAGGVIAVVGMGKSLSSVPIMEAVVKEIDIRGIFCYANCYPTAIAILASGKVNLKAMITHKYKLEDTLKAFEHARSGRDGAIKVIINC